MQMQERVRRIALAAIEEAQSMGLRGADMVKSGFNAACRRIGADPAEARGFLVESGQFETQERGRHGVPNIILYRRGEGRRVEIEEKADALLEAAGIE